MTRRIVIVGAARSGTKIVRDVLARATGSGAVPYDVGFVWRYGNGDMDHDLLSPDMTTPKARDFILRYIDSYSENGVVIEKTVGNTMRVPFVQAILGEVSFVHLIRDGVDVAESARRQWVEPPDTKYLIRKVRHFPPRLLPTYGRKYVISTLSRYRNEGSRADTWGPRYPNIDRDVRDESLLTVCARQWRASVLEAFNGLAQVDSPRIEVRYEQLVSDPESTLKRLLDGLRLGTSEGRFVHALSMLKPGRTGVGVKSLSGDELTTLDREIGPTLQELGYRTATGREDS